MIGAWRGGHSQSLHMERESRYFSQIFDLSARESID